MPLQNTSGNVSADAFGGGVPVAVNYIEDVFSTYLYTGNGGGSATGFFGTQTITNSIDLSTKGGLVWLKARSSAEPHALFDTARGVNKILRSDFTFAQNTAANTVTAFNTTGFNLGSDSDGWGTNTNAVTYASWTFRKQPKFFDVVTYTGNATARTIAHNLGSVPACIIVKCTSNADNWYVYHTSLGATQNVRLNQTNAAATNNFFWDSTAPTSTVFSVGASGNTNQNGDTYVAYLFAHNAGGFGLTGTDNVISCGTFTPNASEQATINLGYEPQWVLYKQAGGSGGNWELYDNMRGMAVTGTVKLVPNTSNAESVNTSINQLRATATGFEVQYLNQFQHIYIAIRIAPMKVPTDVTKVFAPVLTQGGNRTITTNFPVDLLINKPPSAGNAPYFMDRLRGGTTNTYNILQSSSTDAELVGSGLGLGFQSNVGIQSSDSFYNSGTMVMWLNFRRAPSFFDEVCYTGNGSGLSLTHNLTVAPQLIIVKKRSAVGDWIVRPAGVANNYLVLNSTAESNSGSGNYINNPTATTFGIGDNTNVNASGATFVAYLFATCAGVSKVGSYTGNGTTQTIDCGFGAGGARFVLIKRTDATGGWYVYDTARGMTVLTDPYLFLNTASAEVATLGSVTTVSTGFALNSAILAAINVNAGTYIFLAIA
jgi:hypothetical protein